MFTKEMMEGFTELDFAVYDCIVKNKEQVGKMTIKELADTAHVSTATVLRFCKKSGAEGYSEWKLRYREYLKGERAAIKDDSGMELQSFMARVRSADFQNSISKAHQYLAGSRCTIFIGIDLPEFWEGTAPDIFPMWASSACLSTTPGSRFCRICRRTQ